MFSVTYVHFLPHVTVQFFGQCNTCLIARSCHLRILDLTVIQKHWILSCCVSLQERLCFPSWNFEISQKNETFSWFFKLNLSLSLFPIRPQWHWAHLVHPAVNYSTDLQTDLQLGSTSRTQPTLVMSFLSHWSKSQSHFSLEFPN